MTRAILVFKLVILFALFTGCGGDRSSQSSVSEDRNHRFVGERVKGTYNLNGDKVILFAGDFKGDFTYDDCNNASRTIHNAYVKEGKTAKYKSTLSVTLDPNKRFLIFGFRNVTEDSRRNWLCVNIHPNGRETSFYQAGEHKLQRSTGWVKKVIHALRQS